MPFAAQESILELAPGATIDDDVIETMPIDIVLERRTPDDPPALPTVLEELKATKCNARNFITEFR